MNSIAFSIFCFYIDCSNTKIYASHSLCSHSAKHIPIKFSLSTNSQADNTVKAVLCIGYLQLACIPITGRSDAVNNDCG